MRKLPRADRVRPATLAECMACASSVSTSGTTTGRSIAPVIGSISTEAVRHPRTAGLHYDVIGADVLQVVDWAQRLAGELLTYAVALVYDDQAEEQRDVGRGRGLVWLVGMDGNDYATDDWGVQSQQRMIARRTAPIVVPPRDRMPGDVSDPITTARRLAERSPLPLG